MNRLSLSLILLLEVALFIEIRTIFYKIQRYLKLYRIGKKIWKKKIQTCWIANSGYLRRIKILIVIDIRHCYRFILYFIYLCMYHIYLVRIIRLLSQLFRIKLHCLR